MAKFAVELRAGDITRKMKLNDLSFRILLPLRDNETQAQAMGTEITETISLSGGTLTTIVTTKTGGSTTTTTTTTGGGSTTTTTTTTDGDGNSSTSTTSTDGDGNTTTTTQP